MDDENYKWPEDEKFKKFARLIADKVTIFINSGGNIVPVNNGYDVKNCNCPLGAVTRIRYPYLYFREGWKDYSWYDLRDFIDGFDKQVGDTPYAKLGKAYRKEFGF